MSLHKEKNGMWQRYIIEIGIGVPLAIIIFYVLSKVQAIAWIQAFKQEFLKPKSEETKH